MGGGRTAGGVVAGMLASIPYVFLAGPLGLALALSTSSDRVAVLLLPLVVPLGVALVVSCLQTAREHADGFVVGVVWGLVPVPTCYLGYVVGGAFAR